MSKAREVSKVGTEFVKTLTSASISDIPLTVTGASGQTANLVDIKNSAGTTLSSIGADGRLYAADSIVQIKRYEWSNDTTMSGGTWTTATNSSFSFTPLKSTSKILIVGEFALAPYYAGGAYAGMGVRIVRDGTAIATAGQTHEVYVNTGTNPDLYTRTVKSHYINANSSAPTTFTTQIIAYAATTSARINQGNNWTSSYTIYEVSQ